MTRNIRSARAALEQLYSSRDKHGDIVFIVETERIRAHRSILASASPKYETQFYGLRPDEGEIHVPNVLASAFKEFLQLFYKDFVNLTVENIEAVVDLAMQSLVDEFVYTCIDFIEKEIIPHNVCQAYHLAILYDLKLLRNSCEEKIATATKNVFVSDGFLQCDKEMLMQILKLDKYNCTESNVFNACIEWAREFCKRKQLNENDPKHLRNALGDAVYEIRFASMSVNEFAGLRNSLAGFFTDDESLEIFCLIGQMKNSNSQLFNHAQRHQYVHPKPVHVQHRQQRINRMNAGINKRSRCIVIDSDNDDDDEWK